MNVDRFLFIVMTFLVTIIVALHKTNVISYIKITFIFDLSACKLLFVNDLSCISPFMLFDVQGVTLTDLQEAEKTIGRSRSTRTREQENEEKEKEEKEKQDKEKQEEKKESETSREDEYKQKYSRTYDEVMLWAAQLGQVSRVVLMALSVLRCMA